MSIFDENKFIEINKEDINDALQTSGSLDENIRKRAFANVLGARLGIKFLMTLESNSNNYESLYTIPAVLKDIDISDINTDNNIKLDIRIVEDENHLCIPKAQFDLNITPDIYIFIRLEDNLSAAAFIGAIPPDEIDTSVQNENYYFISSDTLYNEQSLKKVLKKGKPKANIEPDDNEVLKAESMLVNFIDQDILSKEKLYVYSILKQSQKLRAMFKDFEHFELLSKDLAHTDEILSDSVLDVLGAQQLYKNDLTEDSEFASDIDLDELAVETAADFVEEFIDQDSREDEMLDNNDNEIIEGEFEELPEDEEINEAGQLEELPSDDVLASFSDNFQDFSENDTEEISEIETEDNNIGFEGFEGLGEENSVSFEDIDLNFDTNANEENSINDESNILENDMFSVDMQDLETLKQNDNLKDEINDTTDSNSDDNTLNISEENSFSDVSFEENASEYNPLETFDTPIDLTLPELQPDSDLPLTDGNEDEDAINFMTAESENIEDATSQYNENVVSFDNDNEGIIDYTNTPGFSEHSETENNFDNFENFETIEPIETELDTTGNENFESLPDLNLEHNFNDSENLSDSNSIQAIEPTELTDDNTDNNSLLNNAEFDLEDLQPLEQQDNSEEMFINENLNDSDNSETNEITLDSISQDISFEDNLLQDVPQIDEELSNSENEISDDATEHTLDSIAEPLYPEQNIQTTKEVDNSQESSEDLGSFEEFTMDMATAYEEANPDKFNSKKMFDGSIEELPAFDENDFKMTDTTPFNTDIENNLDNTQNEIAENNDIQGFTADNFNSTDIENTLPDLELNADFGSLEPIEPVKPEGFTLEDETDNTKTNIQQEDISSDVQPFDTSFEMETLDMNTNAPEISNEQNSSEMETLNNLETFDEISDFGSFDVQNDVSDTNTTMTSSEDKSDDFELESIDFDSLNEQTTHEDYSNINLDELDDDDRELNILNEDTSKTDIDVNDINIDSEINNLVNSDIDISELNIDDIDLNDPSLNIENLDIDMNNLEGIENIPDIANENGQQNQEFQEQTSQEAYNPDFTQNDQSTIEALYDSNNQGQPNEAMNESFNQNNVNTKPKPQKTQKKKGSPLLAILLIVLVGAFGYLKKDLILEKINSHKGISMEQDQNMPVEGESQEDTENEKLLNDNTPVSDESEEGANQGIGNIPGEEGGPQDAKSMEESLHQKGSMANNISTGNYAKAPEPLASCNIRKLYWEIPQDLTYNELIVNYLKTIGKTIKFAAQSDLLNASEMPYSNKIIINIIIKKDGSVDEPSVSVSSGSKQIDAIVLQSVKAATKYVKAPTSEFKQDSYNFSLIINF